MISFFFCRIAFNKIGKDIMRNSISFVRKYILNLITCLFVISFTILTPVKVFANDNGHETEEKFDAGELIFDHILDSYDWHICTWKGNHISVYLPIIVYSEGEFYCFSSKNFHHEHQYHAKNKHGDAVVFEIAEDGKYKGKVVRVLEDGTQIRPLDISITKTVCGLFISCTLLVVVFLLVAKGYRERGEKAPKGIQALVEPIILYVRDDIAKPNIGEHYERYFPYLLTVFFFIFFNNLLGLIPFFPFGVNITGNIAVTAVLALFTFVITNFMGSKHYYEDIFNTPGVPWWLKFPLPLMPVIELVGCFIKPFVLAVRLFANITAGHIVLLGFICMIFILGEMSAMAGAGMSVLSVLLAVFADCLEVLVAFIQAYVFTLLSSIYFGMAAKHS